MLIRWRGSGRRSGEKTDLVGVVGKGLAYIGDYFCYVNEGGASVSDRSLFSLCVVCFDLGVKFDDGDIHGCEAVVKGILLSVVVFGL